MGAFRQCNALKCKAIERKNHQWRKPSRIRNGAAFEMHGKFT
jgi:hypothetical protein